MVTPLARKPVQPLTFEGAWVNIPQLSCRLEVGLGHERPSTTIPTSSIRERFPPSPDVLEHCGSSSTAGREVRDLCAMRLINRSGSLLFLVLVVLAASLFLQPSVVRAKTVVPIEFGDPIDNDEGPAKGPAKGAAKSLSSRVTNTPSLNPHSRIRLLPPNDGYLLVMLILRQWWR
jgi:hypothetical protein